MYLEVEETGFILLLDLTYISWLSLHAGDWKFETWLMSLGPDHAGCPQEASQGLGGYRQVALELFSTAPRSGPIHYTEMNCSKINV